MAQKTTTTLFIGGGNMGTAILTGFSDSGGEMDSVCVVDPFMEVDAGGRLGLRGYTAGWMKFRKGLSLTS